MSLTAIQGCKNDKAKKMVTTLASDALGLDFYNETDFISNTAIETPNGLHFVIGFSITKSGANLDQDISIPLEISAGGKTLKIDLGNNEGKELLLTKVTTLNETNKLIFTNLAKVVNENGKKIKTDTTAAKQLSKSLQVDGQGTFALYIFRQPHWLRKWNG